LSSSSFSFSFSKIDRKIGDDCVLPKNAFGTANAVFHNLNANENLDASCNNVVRAVQRG